MPNDYFQIPTLMRILVKIAVYSALKPATHSYRKCQLKRSQLPAGQC